jgi:hypothetical protein
VLGLCREQGVEAPAESWPLLIRIVEGASGLDGDEITAETKIIRDIGPTG